MILNKYIDKRRRTTSYSQYSNNEVIGVKGPNKKCYREVEQEDIALSVLLCDWISKAL